MDGLQGWNICWFQAVTVTGVLYEGWPRERPLIRTDGKKEGWVTVLTDSVQKTKVLPLPVGSRE